jgi:hypothetical protein
MLILLFCFLNLPVSTARDAQSGLELGHMGGDCSIDQVVSEVRIAKQAAALDMQAVPIVES